MKGAVALFGDGLDGERTGFPICSRRVGIGGSVADAQAGWEEMQVFSQFLRVENEVWEEVDSEGLAVGKARHGVMPARTVSSGLAGMRYTYKTPGQGEDRTRSVVVRRDQA